MNFTLLILVCARICGKYDHSPTFFPRAESCFNNAGFAICPQIKAKNYDKVEKVSFRSSFLSSLEDAPVSSGFECTNSYRSRQSVWAGAMQIFGCLSVARRRFCSNPRTDKALQNETTRLATSILLNQPDSIELKTCDHSVLYIICISLCMQLRKGMFIT